MTTKPELQQGVGGDAGRVQLAIDGDIVLPCACALRGDDVTLYFEKNQFLSAVNKAIDGGHERGEGSALTIGEPPFTIDVSGRVRFQAQDNTPGGHEGSIQYFRDARIHAALAFGGKYYSVTIRSKNGGNVEWDALASRIQTMNVAGVSGKENKLNTNGWDEAQWSRACLNLGVGSLDEKSWNENSKFWGTQCSMAEILFKAMFPYTDTGTSAGLVLVTGGTGSGKTTILNAIVARYLHRLFEPSGSTDWEKPDRRPHVVAIGDPVETLFHTGKERRIQDCGASQLALSEERVHCRRKLVEYLQRRIDFTARMIGTDVPSVSFALKDALRETPALYIVSELREENDFRATLKFAESGQLIFATAHSTSLVDTMRKLMMLLWGEDTSHTRSLLAQRLKGVIHLKKAVVDGRGLTLPSLWVGNAAGVRQFVCDGLSSLLPGSAVDGRDGQPKGALGRAWVAGKLFTDLDVIRAAHRMDLSIH